MPIKFRCQHCRQFLGISRSKAGQAVDCPTCGRTVRVPNLDGSIEPIPEPKLNVDELAGALNELARIGEEPSTADEEHASETAPVSQPARVKVLAPLPQPEPISLAPPPQAVAVDLQGEQHASRAKSADPLAELANEKRPATAAPAARSAPTSTATPFRNPVVLVALLVVLGVGILSGWMLHGMTAGEPIEPTPQSNTNPNPAKTVPVKIPPVYHPDNWKPALTGQITYHTLDGRNKPDAGARILVLPKTRKGGQSKLPSAGFWANADEADFRVSLAGLRELGGNAILADQNGKFTISLPPTAGTFQILLISHYKQLDAVERIDQSTVALVRMYFDRPDALIKQLAYKQHTLHFNGRDVETWNPTFE